MPHVSRKVRSQCRGLWACLFTTAFLFCFALLALYKYAVVDVDSVLMRNSNSGGERSFDYGDYGIDVSAIRSEENENKNGTSSAEKWNDLVRKEGGVRMGYVTDDCDTPSVINGVIYLTRNKKNGLKVVVVVNCTAEKDINTGDGEAVIVAKFGKILVLNQTLELCSIDEELLQCPIKKGFDSYRREVMLPKFTPKGRYHGTVWLRYSDTKETKLCAKGRMIL